jgi:hypothetical protein
MSHGINTSLTFLILLLYTFSLLFTLSILV